MLVYVRRRFGRLYRERLARRLLTQIASFELQVRVETMPQVANVNPTTEHDLYLTLYVSSAGGV